MKLNYESIRNREAWTGYHLPEYDPAAIAANTALRPQWLHFGSGNIFRSYLAALCQRLIEQGGMDTGIVCCGGRDEEVVTKCYRPHDNLAVAVTLNTDGTLEKEVIGSMSMTLTTQHDSAKIAEVFSQPSLQMVTFTITEKGYSLRDADHELTAVVAADMANGPVGCKHLMAQLAALCIGRMHACGKPLALVSMDNCSHNGEKLRGAVLEIARAWLDGGKITAEEYAYLETEIAFPWTVIDKITPRPHPIVEQRLVDDGLEDIRPFVTTRGSHVAPFVNAEKCQYLAVEDCFPNGRPPLERVGVIFTDRDTVNKVEKMKVCTCLNPLHTCLAVYGCLLGFTSIAAEMKDADLVAFITKLSRGEGMPFVVNPGVIDPEKFLNEVLTVRFPNPFMPDTPQRIAEDTSQKLSIRYGETIKAYIASPDREASELTYIPLVLAGWLRYLIGVNDAGEPFALSSDPLLVAMQEKLAGLTLGGEIDEEQLRPILSDASLFGVDLYSCGLGEKVTGYFKELMAAPGAVRATVHKYVG